EIPVVILAWGACAARAGVRRDQHEAEFSGPALGSSLDHEGFFRACQAGKIKQHRHTALLRLWRQEYRKLHRQADGRRIMPVKSLRAAETAMAADDLEGIRRHCVHSLCQ